MTGFDVVAYRLIVRIQHDTPTTGCLYVQKFSKEILATLHKLVGCTPTISGFCSLAYLLAPDLWRLLFEAQPPAHEPDVLRVSITKLAIPKKPLTNFQVSRGLIDLARVGTI